MRKKGFTLVELMVVVAIIAILAAVAVPMYTKFQQKSRIGTAIKAAMGVMQPFQEWYASEESFSTLSMAADNSFDGLSRDGSAVKVGVSLPFIERLTWIPTFTNDKIVIEWTFTDGCPAIDCEGRFCLFCQDEGCDLEIQMTPGSQFSTLAKDPGDRTACSL